MLPKLLVALVAAAVAVKASEPALHPVVQPPLPGNGYDLGDTLLNFLPPTSASVDDWGKEWIPKDCKDIAQGRNPIYHVASLVCCLERQLARVPWRQVLDVADLDRQLQPGHCHPQQPGHNMETNFVWSFIVALYDKVVPGGIGIAEPNWNAIFHQYATAQGYAPDNVFKPGGTCSARLVDSAAVWASDKPTRADNHRRLASKPDTSFKSDIAIIPGIPKALREAIRIPM